MNENVLIILGFGGHARSTADVALSCGFTELVFVDSNAFDNEFFLSFPVYHEIPKNITNCFCAAGDNILRKKQYNHALNNGLNIVTLFSSRATCGVGSVINIGSLIAHHAHIGPMTEIGKGCIINTAAVVEHDCEVGDFSHVSVNAAVAGRAKIGNNVFIGAGAVVRDGVTIGDNITIGAGATVVHDLHEPGIYIGTPAKLMSGRG